MPGVQKPHCRRVLVAQRLLHRVQRAVGRGEAFDRGHRGAIRLNRQHQAGAHRRAPSTITVQAPQTPCSQPTCVPV